METPEGYSIPRAAQRLIDAADANGWACRWAWAADSSDDPFVTVAVGRITADRYPWRYQITWHNRGLPRGRLRLFGGWAREPAEFGGMKAESDAPPVKRICEIIRENPVMEESEE